MVDASPTPPTTGPTDGATPPSLGRTPLWLRVVLGWALASVLLWVFSRSQWWLCALGGLGALLLIWPGPKPKASRNER